MKKIILISLAFLSYNDYVNAQALGAKIGYNQAMVGAPTLGQVYVTKNNLPDTLNLQTTDALRKSYGVGGFVRFGYEDLKPFFLQIDGMLWYNKAAYAVTDRSATPATLSTYERARYRLDLPITLGLKFWWLRVNGGIVPTIPFGEGSPTRNFEPWFTDTFNNVNFMYTAGVGLDIIERISIDVRLQNDFGTRRETTIPDSFGNYTEPNYISSRNKQAQLLVTLGYRFSRTQ